MICPHPPLCDDRQTPEAKRRLTGDSLSLSAYTDRAVLQVQVDIRELRQKWVMPRVERVTTNTFKLYLVREQLKLSKVR